MKEEALLLGIRQSLVAVYTPPACAVPGRGHKTAFVLFNAGLIHHVGPHRFHVKLARSLAAQGISTMRVDLSGIGDSAACPGYVTAEELVVTESREILDELTRRGHDGFVLCGICSGAKNAKLAAIGDRRVKGLVLINTAATLDDPEMFTQMAARFYLRRSIWNPRAWLNLFTGRVKYKLLFQTLLGMSRRVFARGGPRLAVSANNARSDVKNLVEQGVRVLAVLSDRHAQAFMRHDDKLADLQRDGRLQIRLYPRADHMFTSLEDEKALLGDICRWAEIFSDASGTQPANLQPVSVVD